MLRRMLYIALAILLALVLLPAGILAFYVEDWKRDLSTNYAATDAAAADAALRRTLDGTRTSEASRADQER